MPLALGVALAFVVGAAALAIEVLAPRRVAPHLGTSVVAWTSSVLAVLGGLAAGNALGGVLADRRGPRTAIRLALLAAAAATAAMVALDRALAPALARLPLQARAPLHLLGIAFLPSLGLGAVGPGLARACTLGSPSPGRALGALSAAGSAGAVVGVYVTGHVLIPALPTSHAIAWVAGLLAFLGVAARGLPHGVRDGGSVPASEAGEHAPLFLPCLVAFVAGLATLATEVLAARVAAWSAGSGLTTWSAVLAVSLAALAVGGAAGGAIRDRRPLRAARTCLFVAGVLLLATPWSAPGRPSTDPSAFPLALRVAGRVAVAWGAPLAALASASVLAARAAADGGGERVGARVGAVYAWGTVGAALGVLGTSPLAVPALGAVGTTLVLAAVLAAAAPRRAPGLVAAGVAGLLALGAIAPDGIGGDVGRRLRLRADGPHVEVTESAYTRVLVRGAPPERSYGREARQLLLDDKIHGTTDPSDPRWLGTPYLGTYVALTDHVVEPGRPLHALCLGGGAYLIPRWLLADRPGSTVDVAEIDPEVTRVARASLGVPTTDAMRVHHEDARTFLRDLPPSAPRYDVVYGDAFADVAVPFHLTSEEAVRAVSASLRPEGAYLMNVIDRRDDPAFARAVQETLRRVFPFVQGFEDDRADPPRVVNMIFLAAHRTVDVASLFRRDASYPPNAVHVRRLDLPPGPAPLLTDDHAPVEHLLAPVAEARRPSR